MWLGIVRRWWPVLAWWSLISLVAACGGGKDGTGPNGSTGQYAGDYILAGADDEAMPTVVTSDACAPARIVNGGLTVSRNGEWQMQFNWEDNDGEPKSVGDQGHWEEEIDGWVRFYFRVSPRSRPTESLSAWALVAAQIHLPEQRLESRVAAQVTEEEGALDPEDATGPLLARGFQPVQRDLVLAQPGGDVGHVIG